MHIKDRELEERKSYAREKINSVEPRNQLAIANSATMIRI